MGQGGKEEERYINIVPSSPPKYTLDLVRISPFVLLSITADFYRQIRKKKYISFT